MKNWLYIIYIGLMGCLVSSCQQSLDEEVQLPTIGKAQITFTIALDDIHSRATWKENETAKDAVVGSEKENEISLNSADSLQVLVYNLDGALLGKVTNKELRRISANEYRFNGYLEVNNLTSETLTCRLMVYANCATNVFDIFTCHNDKNEYEVNHIPMWGVKETTLQLAKGELTQLNEPIYLLRAMAKVEVRLDESIADDFDLTSVAVDKYNTTGYVKPKYTTFIDTENMDQDTFFNPYTSLAGKSLSFTEGGEDAFYIYLPEYDNSSSPATISILIDGKPYTVEFKNYQDGSAIGNPYNIVRNHYYQYIIKSVKTVDDVLIAELLYQSMPWTDVNNGNLNFGNGSGDVMN